MELEDHAKHKTLQIKGLLRHWLWVRDGVLNHVSIDPPMEGPSVHESENGQFPKWAKLMNTLLSEAINLAIDFHGELGYPDRPNGDFIREWLAEIATEQGNILKCDIFYGKSIC